MLIIKRLRRFDLPSAEHHHAMIMGGDSAYIRSWSRNDNHIIYNYVPISRKMYMGNEKKKMMTLIGAMKKKEHSWINVFLISGNELFIFGH